MFENTVLSVEFSFVKSGNIHKGLSQVNGKTVEELNGIFWVKLTQNFVVFRSKIWWTMVRVNLLSGRSDRVNRRRIIRNRTPGSDDIFVHTKPSAARFIIFNRPFQKREPLNTKKTKNTVSSYTLAEVFAKLAVALCRKVWSENRLAHRCCSTSFSERTRKNRWRARSSSNS